MSTANHSLFTKYEADQDKLVEDWQKRWPDSPVGTGSDTSVSYHWLLLDEINIPKAALYILSPGGNGGIPRKGDKMWLGHGLEPTLDKYSVDAEFSVEQMEEITRRAQRWMDSHN